MKNSEVVVDRYDKPPLIGLVRVDRSKSPTPNIFRKILAYENLIFNGVGGLNCSFVFMAKNIMQWFCWLLLGEYLESLLF